MAAPDLVWSGLTGHPMGPHCSQGLCEDYVGRGGMLSSLSGEASGFGC